MVRLRHPGGSESAHRRSARVISGVIFLVCLTVTEPAAALRGDADCNGAITAADLSAAITALFEPGPCADADVNGDGAKRASDVTAELQRLYGPSQESAFDQDEMMIQAALHAVTAVASQEQEVGAYVARVCGFVFAINGV